MPRFTPTGPTELLLIRHAESRANVAASAAEASGALEIEVEHRDPDCELSSTGEEQARALGDWLGQQRPPLAAWSSPYLRATATARHALATAGLDIPVTQDERLRDRDLGITDGFTPAGLLARFPEEARRRAWLGNFYYRPPGGEAWTDLALRVRSLLEHLDSVAPVGPVALFCHDAIVLIIRYLCEGLSERELLDISEVAPVANASLTRLARVGDTWRLDLYNYVHHRGSRTRHDDRASEAGNP
ncbi:histidine phosphatase family protein [Rathayibacter toxicus]|uniref:phosphoglycerate mutase (2,3-diphosphoglycerate-dependent) n=1 Tax=Rathayibacter toxicus TaxID=145458 RepID=A0A2S5Y9S2_9MICO|nr:histidine phosphatase family protein [Rathayibacter toxicus]ALS57403.1 hypothetical protein APU90_06150 [Rathayibacter toxicus]PPG24718.1 histidine phosphatase family protein [Rathayibacter toxicus]PPG48172.1 histidine phosphatase family protein [Rathayibacter toxicus]PPH25473.1 histidine phosphatase family protein [Rathayibacter toxicus]PPH59176.1 histidine phosphatase family protein [Rathayibacter toxicus]